MFFWQHFRLYCPAGGDVAAAVLSVQTGRGVRFDRTSALFDSSVRRSGTTREVSHATRVADVDVNPIVNAASPPGNRSLPCSCTADSCCDCSASEIILYFLRGSTYKPFRAGKTGGRRRWRHGG